MQIAINDEDIDEFMGIINQIAQEHPILVDKYIMGKELEVDAVCDGKDILIPGIMEHIERTGVHSGDSISVYPAYNVSESNVENHRGVYREAGQGAPRKGNDQYSVYRRWGEGLHYRGKSPGRPGPSPISARLRGSPSCPWQPR